MKRTMYKMLRLSNDLNAIRKGKFGKRIGRRLVGRMSGKFLRKLF